LFPEPVEHARMPRCRSQFSMRACQVVASRSCIKVQVAAAVAAVAVAAVAVAAARMPTYCLAAPTARLVAPTASSR
jgi:hypothetical protein